MSAIERDYRIIGTECEYPILSKPTYSSLSGIGTANSEDSLLANYIIQEVLKTELGFAVAISEEDYRYRIYTENGGCLYEDCSHVEYSSPECSSPELATIFDLAGIEMIKLICLAAEEKMLEDFGTRPEISAYRSVSDSNKNVWGYHENYMIDLEYFTDYPYIVTPLYSFLASRQLFSGTGNIIHDGEDFVFVNSQRGRFIKKNEHAWSTNAAVRPIIKQTSLRNTYSNPGYYRVQVVCGDQNLSQDIIYYNLAITSALLEVGEKEKWKNPPIISDTPRACRIWSYDPEVMLPAEDGNSYNAFEVQRMFFDNLRFYADVTEDKAIKKALSLWGALLDQYEFDREKLFGVVEWYTKKAILERLAERGHSLGSDVARAANILFHQIYPKPGLFLKISSKRNNQKFLKSQIDSAVTNPPLNTRAFTRGQAVAIQKHPKIESVHIIDWNELVIKAKGSPWEAVNLIDPHKKIDLITRYKLS